MKKIAVVLAGCGFKDGSEIRESVLALWALSMEDADVKIYAPDIEIDEVDHLSFEPTGKKRSLLKEAARIARGKIESIEKASAKDFDALVLPGGFGVAKNLCTFAAEGPNLKLERGVERLLEEFIEAKKPIGAICIAPVLLAKAFQKRGGVKLTLGAPSDASKAIEAMGVQHKAVEASDIVVDADRKVVSTPAYMYGDASLKDISQGIHKLVRQVLAFA